MRSVRKRSKTDAMESPSLHGYSIDVNVCRNPHCENFGISEGDIEDRTKAYKVTYNQKSPPTVQCKRCGKMGGIYSNTSVVEAFHACLPLTIPYACCPNDECDLHHYNVFEYSSTSLKQPIKKPYYVNNKERSQARCRGCNKTYRLSPPLRLHTENRKDWLRQMEVFINAIVDGQGPSNVMNQQRIPADRYYSQLNAAADSFGQYNRFNVAELMRHEYPHEEMNIYTDSLVSSIKVFRKGKRVQLKKIIVSVAEYKQRSLVLAFHPLFHEHKFDETKLADDARLPLEEQHYAYLKHPFRKDIDDLPLLGLGGYSMEDFYTYMAHFLILRKLLKQVNKVNFFMDGELALHTTAALAFSDKIKNKACDIVIIKSEKLNTGNQINNAKVRSNRIRRNAIAEYKKEFPDQRESISHKDVRRFLLNKERERINNHIKKTSIKKKLSVKEILPKIFSEAIHRANKRKQPSVKTVFDFKHGFEDATRISEWLGFWPKS